MSDIKMGDVFELPVYQHRIDDAMLDSAEKRVAEFSNEQSTQAVIYAVNDHDRLTAENEALREELSAQKVISESYMSERDRYKELADERLETLADVEQEHDQLKAALKRFMELDVDDPDLKDDLWCIQQEEAPNL